MAIGGHSAQWAADSAPIVTIIGEEEIAWTAVRVLPPGQGRRAAVIRRFRQPMEAALAREGMGWDDLYGETYGAAFVARVAAGMELSDADRYLLLPKHRQGEVWRLAPRPITDAEFAGLGYRPARDTVFIARRYAAEPDNAADRAADPSATWIPVGSVPLVLPNYRDIRWGL